MSDSKISEQLDYPFLLLTHIICADQQIHSEESKALRELATKTQAGQRTLLEMEKILAQDEQQISITEIALQVPRSQQAEAMRQILALAYIDGFFSPLEREMVEKVAQHWKWSKKKLQQLIEEAEGFTTNRSINEENEPSQLSFGARLLKGTESLLSCTLVDNLAKIAPENVGRRIEELRKEILLAGPEYDEAIERCATIANEDYKFAEVALKAASSALYNLGKGIQNELQTLQTKTSGNSQAKSAAEVAKQLETTRKALTAEIIKEIETVRESLAAKQRALNHFSIAFMGKTKAGKSTLHAIITGEGWDAIGVGKQRTTRFNRVYEWKNIRIIDTPGIGAPGGKTDEEIAQSVIEESDVVCYVVTNDSIQETEFGFLRLLKEKAKPLIVLLNIKNNLRDTRRLDYFLKDPDKQFTIDGKSGIGGHIERIHRYAKEHYANDYFSIVPVMLLAAQMSRESEHQQQKDKLFKASRMQDFLDSIRLSLVEYGVIRRSQTLLGSTVGALDNPYQWVSQQAEVYQKLTDTLKNKRETIQKNIKKAEKDSIESLRHQIEAVFQDAFNAIPYFAEDYWESSEEGLKQGWNRKFKNIKFEERIDTAYKEVGQNFNKKVAEVIEEIGKELQLIAQLGGGNFNFTTQDSDTFMRHFMRIGGSLLTLFGGLLQFTPFAPIGWVFIGVGIVANMVSNFFKSKHKKRLSALSMLKTTAKVWLSGQFWEFFQ
ncbi:GTPase [Floridanema aerugineum]|uniref:GTPase n=1 Tax=Floridaenema aerugineum BLCC-F46 TaxID=3153654 RepID=A0ABV4WXP1_9CYAN